MFIRRLLFLSIIFLFVSCQQEISYLKLNGYTMGTSYQITLETDQKSAKTLHQKIARELKNINQLMSTYIDDSELSQLNHSSSLDCQRISEQTYYVIKSAFNVSQQTKGQFDVTVGPLISEWGFDKKQTNDQVPSSEKIEKLLKQVGYNKIKLGGNCIVKETPRLSINLSAIAKGYGVDQVASLIELDGVSNYLVEIGGEVASSGINARGTDWRLAIESPVEQQRKIQTVFTPKGLGVATSGDYRNYFDKDNKRFSHTINPITGRPITHNLVSVTVLHAKTMMADAYATAFMVMGKEATLEFAREHKLAVYLLVKTDSGIEAFYSDQFSRNLVNKE